MPRVAISARSAVFVYSSGIAFVRHPYAAFSSDVVPPASAIRVPLAPYRGVRFDVLCVHRPLEKMSEREQEHVGRVWLAPIHARDNGLAGDGGHSPIGREGTKYALSLHLSTGSKRLPSRTFSVA